MRNLANRSSRSDAAASEFRPYMKAEITDPDGNWRDVSIGLNGPDFFNRAGIDMQIDGNSQQFSMSVLRDAIEQFQILTNPEFAGGSLAKHSVYDNAVSGQVTLTADEYPSEFNRSGYRMKVTTAGAGTNPGMGGFSRAIGEDGGTYMPDKYHQGDTILWKIVAEIPVGYNIAFATNATGTGTVLTPITSLAGTGAPFEYIWKQVIGVGGTLSSTGFFYLTGAAPVTWYVYSDTAWSINAPLSLVPLRTDSAINRNAAGTYAPLLELRRKWRFSTAVMRPGFFPSLARSNVAKQASNLSLTPWTISGLGSRTQDIVGLSGLPNSGTTISDTDAAGLTLILQTSMAIPADTATHCVWVAFRKDTDQTRFPSLRARLTGGATPRDRSMNVNTQTGAFGVYSVVGGGSSRVVDGALYGYPDFWFVEHTLVNDGTHTNIELRLHPARSTTTLTASVVTATGGVGVGHAQVELNSSFLNAPIFTTTAAITAYNDWSEIGQGYVDRIAIEDESPTIEVTGRDLGAIFLDAYIRTKRTYGSAAGTAIATVLQSIINDNATDNGYSGVTLTVDASAIAFSMNLLTLDEGGLLQQLNTVAGKAGMIVRMDYNAADQMVLTLSSPNRTATVPDWTIASDEYTSIPINALDIEGVRNLVLLKFFNTTTGLIETVQSPSSGTSASITKYGILPMFIDAAADSGINTTAKAQIKADAVRLDLETPSLEQQIIAPNLVFAELGDYVQLVANGVQYDTDQFGGIVSIHHEFANGEIETTLGLKGKPAGRYRTWLAEGQSDSGATAVDTGPPPAPTARVTQSAITVPTITTETLTLDGTTNRGAAGDLLMTTRWRVIDSRTGLGVWSAWVANASPNALPLEAAVTRGLKWEKTFEWQVRDELGQVATDSYVVHSKRDALNDNGVVDDQANMSSGVRPFRRTVDLTSEVVSQTGRGFIDQAGLDVSLRPTSVYRGAGYEPTANLFKRGTDLASDVVITSTRTFVDPNSATQVDASGRIVGVYRLGVYEPVNNLVKTGDAITGSVPDTSLSSNIPRKNAANTFTVAQTFSAGAIASSFQVTGGNASGNYIDGQVGSYGSFRAVGSYNGYSGIEFASAGGNLMMDNTGVFWGLWYSALSDWRWLFDDAQSFAGANTISTRETYLAHRSLLVNTSGGMMFANSANVLKGRIHWDATGFGLLDSASAWRITVTTAGGTLFGAFGVTGDLTVTGRAFQQGEGTTVRRIASIIISSAAPTSGDSAPDGTLWLQT